MSRKSKDHQSLEEVLKDFVGDNKLTKGLDKVRVKELWFDLLGNGVANYTTNVILKNDTLHVTLSSSVLREELTYGKEKIITMLNEGLGKELIKKLVLR